MPKDFPDYIGAPSAALTGKQPGSKARKRPLKSKHKSKMIIKGKNDLFPGI